MNPHQHLHQGPSSSSNASKSADESTQNSRTRGRFLSKINRLVLRSGQSSPRGTASISAPSPPDPFKIIHEPDTMPLYSPPRPMMPRTESECEEALEEMFSYTRDGARRPSTAPSEAPTSQIRMLSDYRKPPTPPLPPPKDGHIPPRSLPRPLNTSISTQPPRTAGARLESIPGSPLSPSTIRSMPTPTGHGFPIPPRTLRIVHRKGIQRAVTGDFIQAPRPLSERALIPLGSLSRIRHSEDIHPPRSPLSMSAPLTSSPVRMTFASRPESDQPRAQTMPNAQSRPREQRHSPLSPLGQSLPMVLSPSRLTHTTINEITIPRRPSRPDDHEHFPLLLPFPPPPPPPPPPSLRRPRPHPQLSFDSMRVNDSATTSSDSDDDDNEDDKRTPTLPSSRHIPALARAPASREPLSAKCYMCPEPCSPSQGLCTACQARFRPQSVAFDDSDWDSDSDYEDIDVRTTPSLSPRRRTKPKPLSVKTTTTTTAHANGRNKAVFTVSPGPMTPTHHPSFSRPITPTTRAQLQHPCTTHSSWPRTPESPRGWSRFSNSPRQASDPRTPSLSISPPQQRNSPATPASGSALFHLERSMQRENWQPLTPGASPQNGHDVVRVGSVPGGEARRVVVRDSNDEGADTMKMLADEEGFEERRSGGGGGYGDWFSYYAEKEGREAQKRTSAASSIYDRIQSIYDAYAGEEDEYEDEGREFGMI